jgi:hypothetical protein
MTDLTLDSATVSHEITDYLPSGMAADSTALENHGGIYRFGPKPDVAEL